MPKISELGAITTPTDDDITVVVNDPAGTPVAQKLTWANLKATLLTYLATSGVLAVTRPKVTTSIDDTNGNEVIKTPATTSAVNEITVTNAATGSGPTISATGGDTNIPLNLASKGTGAVNTSGGQHKFCNTGDGSGTIADLEYGAGSKYYRFAYNNLQIDSSINVLFGTIGTGFDLGLTRHGAGMLEINSSAAGTLRDIMARAYYYSSTVFYAAGTGSPEGVVTAGIGSTWRRTDGGAGTSFYVKESDSGNTGWIGK